MEHSGLPYLTRRCQGALSPCKTILTGVLTLVRAAIGGKTRLRFDIVSTTVIEFAQPQSIR